MRRCEFDSRWPHNIKVFMVHPEQMPHQNNSEERESGFSVSPRIERVHEAYAIYVGSREDAEKIVKEFWRALGDPIVLKNIEQGIAHPMGQITSGPRTDVLSVSRKEFKDAGYAYMVFINQNGQKLAPETETAVFKMQHNLGIPL